jgi:hypothetical protein
MLELRSCCRRHVLTAKPSNEFVGILFRREAFHDVLLPVTVKRVTAHAQRQPLEQSQACSIAASAGAERWSTTTLSPRKPGSWWCSTGGIGKLCASCFDVEAEKANVRYSLVNVSGTSWSDQPPPRNPYKRKR